jgi:hypothetical protein
VDWAQIIFGGALVAVLLFLSLFYGLRESRALRRLRSSEEMPADERRYERNKAWRRLVSSALFLILAGLLAGALVFLEAQAKRIADEHDAHAAAGTEHQLTPEQQRFGRVYHWYWMTFLLVLLAVVLLAAADVWSIRRYGVRQHRKIQADRRAMIERQLVRLRQQRNGEG